MDIFGVLNTIGGTSAGARNVISGNGRNGVLIGGFSFQPQGNVLQGNLIATQADGLSPLGNAGDGILLVTDSNTIGGTAAGAANTVAFNAGAGVFVQFGTGNAIAVNSIFSNTGLGIDLDPAGVAANDPGDPDVGANNQQNFPVLTSATSSGGTTTIRGTLDSAPNTTFRIEFFANPACDPSGNGEGKTFLGSTTVTTRGSGEARLSASFGTVVPIGQFVTATATDPGNNTSEFSACVVVS